MDPARPALEEYVMSQKDNVHCLVEQKELPGWGVEFGIIQHASPLDELARLDSDAGADRKPAEDIGRSTAITLKSKKQSPEANTYQYTMDSRGRKDRCPVIRSPGGWIHTGQLGHSRSRASQSDQSHNTSIQHRDTSALLHANDHGGRQSDPAVGDIEPDGKDIERADGFLHLRLETEGLEDGGFGIDMFA